MLASQAIWYRGLHNHVERRLGKPNVCSECSFTSNNRRQFHWANISGLYLRDLSDWKRLCASCHLKYDNRRACHRGHPWIPETTYINKRLNRRQCAICKSRSRKLYRQRTGL